MQVSEQQIERFV